MDQYVYTLLILLLIFLIMILIVKNIYAHRTQEPNIPSAEDFIESIAPKPPK